MRCFRQAVRILLGLAIGWNIGPRMAASGQADVELAVAENDPNQNSVPVSAIAFSPDGALVATGHGKNLGMLQDPSPGQTILWDSRTGKRVKTIPAREDGVHSVAFSPDGKALVVLEAPGIIRLIATAEGRDLRTFQAKEDEPAYFSVAFVPNGKQLVAGLAAPVGQAGSNVVILDVVNGKRLRTLAGHNGPVASVAVSPDGKLVASGAYDGTARIWDIATEKPIATVTFPFLENKIKQERLGKLLIWVQSVAFSPDGRTLAAAANFSIQSAAVEILDVSTGQSLATLKDLDPWMRQVTFSPSGKILVSAGAAGSTTLWDAATFKESGKLKGSWPIAVSPDGGVSAVTVGRRTVLISKSPDSMRR